MNQIKLYYGEF